MLNFKIRTKFIFIGIIGTIFLLCIVFLALRMSTLSKKTVDHIFTDTKTMQKINHDFISPVYQLRELSLSLVVAPNKEFRKNLEIKINTIIKNLDGNFHSLHVKTNKEWQKYKRTLNTTREYIQNGFEEGAFINTNQNERDQFYKLIQALQDLQNDEFVKSSNYFQKSQNNIQNFRWTVIITSLTLGLFTLFLGWFIIQKITNAIEEVKLGHERFFDFLSNKNRELEGISLDSNDELGDMAKTINARMNQITKELHQDLHLIKSATKMLGEIKKGDLDRRIETEASSKELNTLKMVINQLADDLESKIQTEIDKRSAQEKLLIQQSKLATMGNMIGNIAHQWRQPLGELNATLMNISTRYKFGDFDEEFMEKSVQECNEITAYMSNTISDFQNFFKPSKTKQLFNIVDACKKATKIIQSSLKNNLIECTFNYDDEKKVYGYKNEFSQAYLNILSNAKDILITRAIKNPHIKITMKTGKRYTLIKIEDNGGGIDEKILDRVFEPYFTTKHAKQGTGIGLYMSKMIIEENMDGIVRVENTQHGACFTIKLK